MKFSNWVVLTGVLVALWATEPPVALAKKKRRAKRYYPPVTHPVLLWARTLSKSEDAAERKKAAFKLSAYTQPISHEEVVRTLLACTKDSDVEVKVFCTKALRKAGNRGSAEAVRAELVQLYKKDPELRPTVVGALLARQESDPQVQDLLLESLRDTQEIEHRSDLLQYFEKFGSGSDPFVKVLTDVYESSTEPKIKRDVVKALGARAKGQAKVITLLAECAQSKDTPLALNCLAGLQTQAAKDAKTLAAAETTIETTDPDVLDATLDLLVSMPETVNSKISARLLVVAEEFEDPQLVEKAILGLGVVGDHSEAVVAGLQKALEAKESEDSVRIAAALVLGKQSEKAPDKSLGLLTGCVEKSSGSLKTACDLGIRELQARKIANKK